jgi:hypothetical protein
MAFLNAFGALGRLMLLAGLGCAGLGVLFGGAARLTLLIVAFTLGTTGLVFALIGSRLGRVSGLDRHLRAVGVPGTATITSVRETGVLINNSPVLEFVLEVDSTAHAPFIATIRQRAPFHLAGTYRPGSSVSVRVDPSDRDRLAIDWEMPVTSQAAPAPASEPESPAGTRSTVRDAERLLRVGRPARAVVISMRDAGDMSELGLVQVGEPGDDDRLFIIDMEVQQAGLTPYEVRVAHRVPERLVGRIGPRTRLKVAVDREDEHAVAIDWDELAR